MLTDTSCLLVSLARMLLPGNENVNAVTIRLRIMNHFDPLLFFCVQCHLLYG